MARFTVSQIAEHFRISAEPARGLVNFLVEVGALSPAGKAPLTGRGRSENVYEGEENLLRSLELVVLPVEYSI